MWRIDLPASLYGGRLTRKRKPENRGLPAGWRFAHGAYYYQVPPSLRHLWEGKSLFRLGRTLPEAHAVWAAKVSRDTITTIGELLDRYLVEVVPTKAIKTQKDNKPQLARLRRAFGDWLITDLRPKHVYTYAAKRSAPVAARREIALLSHAYTKAVEWGFMDRHPFKGEVRLKGERPRDRYVTDAEIVICLSLPPVWKGDATETIQAYIRLKLLTGLRKSDLLGIRMADLKKDGIHVRTSKTRKAVIYEWSDELRDAVNMVPRKVDIAPTLFCTRRGHSYVRENGSSGWDSIWQRFMKRAIDAGVERFTEHDLRAKAASDADSLDHARALLAHADSRITDKVYRRKPERVRPLR